MTNAPTFDPQTFKDASRSQWDQAAQGWNDHTPEIRAWLRAATQAMLAMADVRTSAHVIDIAAGAGDQTLDIAEAVGPDGLVMATDLSANILAFAQSNAAQAGYTQIEVRVADGEQLPLADASFDAAVCRLGLMFFPDPLQGLREIHRVLKPGGGVCTMVFAGADKNPCIGIIMSIALKYAGLPPPDPNQPGSLLSLGKPGMIDALFKEAGLREVATTSISAPYSLPSARRYLEFIRNSASPIRHILAPLKDSERDAAWDEMEEKLSRFNTSAGWVGPNELLLTAARR